MTPRPVRAGARCADASVDRRRARRCGCPRSLGAGQCVLLGGGASRPRVIVPAARGASVERNRRLVARGGDVLERDVSGGHEREEILGRGHLPGIVFHLSPSDAFFRPRGDLASADGQSQRPVRSVPKRQERDRGVARPKAPRYGLGGRCVGRARRVVLRRELMKDGRRSHLGACGRIRERQTSHDDWPPADASARSQFHSRRIRRHAHVPAHCRVRRLLRKRLLGQLDDRGTQGCRHVLRRPAPTRSAGWQSRLNGYVMQQTMAGTVPACLMAFSRGHWST
jgi:hypothetical protein